LIIIPGPSEEPTDVGAGTFSVLQADAATLHSDTCHGLDAVSALFKRIGVILRKAHIET